MIECPYCGEMVDEKEIIECPQCGREGCCKEEDDCIFAKRNYIYPKCEESLDD